MDTSIYPIPPNFKIKKENFININSSITVSNFPNNCLLSNLKNKRKVFDIYYLIYVLEKRCWKRLKTYKCSFGSKFEIKRNDLKISDETLAVAIPKFNIDKSISERYLPAPDTLRLDDSPIAERVSYNFEFYNNLSSYQGEYPYQISLLKKGSFFSTSILTEEKVKSSHSYLLLINIKNDAREYYENNLKFFNPTSKEVIKSFPIFTNSVKIISLDFLKENFKSEKIFISCDTETFLPIYININNGSKKKEINVEHTHPPYENFWGQDKFIASKIIKNNWVL